MKPYELKYAVESAGHERYFFTRKTMKFFGDTMKNYGVTESVIKTYDKEAVKVWELYRKKPVKHGLMSSAYFEKETFRRVFPVKED